MVAPTDVEGVVVTIDGVIEAEVEDVMDELEDFEPLGVPT